MKLGSTTFLKIVICLIAIAALAVCIFGLPGIIGQEAAKQRPETAYLPYVFLACAYILCIPFFAGLYQAFKLITYMEGNMAFSKLSAGALRRVKYSAITISAMMVAGIAVLMVLSRGKGEDITGIVAPGLLVTFAAIVVATVAAVCQKRVQRAMDVK
jgi:Protein of unknown function (DUF2975)